MNKPSSFWCYVKNNAIIAEKKPASALNSMRRWQGKRIDRLTEPMLRQGDSFRCMMNSWMSEQRVGMWNSGWQMNHRFGKGCLPVRPSQFFRFLTGPKDVQGQTLAFISHHNHIWMDIPATIAGKGFLHTQFRSRMYYYMNLNMLKGQASLLSFPLYNCINSPLLCGGYMRVLSKQQALSEHTSEVA